MIVMPWECGYELRLGSGTQPISGYGPVLAGPSFQRSTNSFEACQYIGVVNESQSTRVSAGPDEINNRRRGEHYGIALLTATVTARLPC